MKHQTIVRAWAVFGVFWFIIFAILTFAPQGLSFVAVIAALSFYAGMILAVVSVAQLLYDLIIKPKIKNTELNESAKPARKKVKTKETNSM